MPRSKATPKYQTNLPKPNYVPGVGPSNAKIAIVGEAPGFEENEARLPFVGSSGRLLSKLLSEAGIDRNQCYVTNVVKYQPIGNDLKTLPMMGISLEEETKKLYHELSTLSPNIICTLGNTALNAIAGRKGISKFRGSILHSVFGDYKVLPTYHPAALLYDKERFKGEREGSREIVLGGETLVIADFVKLKKNSLTKDFPNIPRNLQIIKSEYELYKFLESYKGKTLVSLDIETNKGIPTCIALAFTPYHAVSIPLLPISGYGGGITLTETEYISIWKTLSCFLNRADLRFIGQNFKFDHEKLIMPSKLLSVGTKDKLAYDTSLMMGVAYAEFPKNLAFMTSLFTNEPYYKDEGKEFNPKKDKAEQLLIYNAKDAAVTYEIKQALDKELIEFSALHPPHDLTRFYNTFVNRLHDFYMDVEAEGLEVDLPRRTELQRTYLASILEKQVELNQLVGREFNVRSNPTVREILVKDLKLPPRPHYQKETIVALLGNHTEPNSKESNVLKLILELRQLRTNNNYLQQEPDPDGVMRTTYRITGTETGRTSTGILDHPIRPIESGMAFQTIPKHGPFSKAIRSIFISPPGYVFLEADQSQAEARIVSILSDDPYTLKLFDTTDIHTETTKWIFPNSTSITQDQRFIGKKVRHAGNYGMGKHKLMLTANGDAFKFGLNIQLSEKDAEEILKIFHTRTPKIRRVFQSEVKIQVGKDRTLFNPFGRMRQFFGTIKDEELFAQIPQSTVPDQTRVAGLRVRERLPTIRICLESHDALLFKIPEDKVQEYGKIIKEEFEAPIDFKHCSLSRGELVIPAELSVGKRYSELEKIKI